MVALQIGSLLTVPLASHLHSLHPELLCWQWHSSSIVSWVPSFLSSCFAPATVVKTSEAASCHLLSPSLRVGRCEGRGEGVGVGEAFRLTECKYGTCGNLAQKPYFPCINTY